MPGGFPRGGCSGKDINRGGSMTQDAGCRIRIPGDLFARISLEPESCFCLQPGLSSQSLQMFRIAEKRLDGPCHGGWIFMLHQHSRFAILNHFWNASDAAGHTSGREALGLRRRTRTVSADRSAWSWSVAFRRNSLWERQRRWRGRLGYRSGKKWGAGHCDLQMPSQSTAPVLRVGPACSR